MKISHLGAKDCVTGSAHLVQTRPGSADGVNILVDCGSAYGDDRVPDLIDAGFKGEIICTHATKALLIPMLHDAMSFSSRSDKDVHRLEALIDELSWGFELHMKPLPLNREIWT